MRRKNTAHHSSIFGFAVFIGLLFLLLILGATAIKVFLLFSRSTFDGKHQFVIEVQEPNRLRFVVFNPDSHTINTLLVDGVVSQKTPLNLGVPVDAVVIAGSDILPSELPQNMLFSSSIRSTATIIDAVNLFVFTHVAHISTTTAQRVYLANAMSAPSISPRLFLDVTIYKEGESVAIINGTGIAGLGNKIARLLTNVGANVISVTTADTPSEASSVAYTGQSTYSATRFAHILHLPLVHLSGASVSDITITVGTDKAGIF